MTSVATLQRALQQERWIVGASLAAITALAWIYLVRMASDMPGMSVALRDLAAMPLHPWDGDYFLMIFLMWAVMMVGMMLPSAAPAILIFTRALTQNADSAYPALRSHLFAAGYLLVWVAFSLGATLLQWSVETAALKVPWIAASGPMLGGGVLILAGIYQWTPLKNVCLKNCRGPLDFLTRRWRRSVPGALRMGVEHGLYCLGCCWMLMLLLFVGGVMNLLCIAAISVFVLAEKILPHGVSAGRIGGVLMIAAGALLLVPV